MTVWKNCIADIYYTDNKPELHDPGYEVRITAEELVVSYEGDGGWVNYRGTNLGGGHFDLSCPEVNGRAMLHRTADSHFLEGNWSEDGAHGMWRIELRE